MFGKTEYIRECVVCGEQFKTKFPSAKYCINHRHTRKNPNYRTKCRCSVCGRSIHSGIPIDSEERALCSFCERKEKTELRRIKKAKERFKQLAKKCERCGKLAILVRHTHVCPTCYYKDAFPTATEVKEIGT